MPSGCAPDVPGSRLTPLRFSLEPEAFAFGLLVNVLWCPMESPLKEHLRGLANLCAFCDRGRERYYGPTSSFPITGHLGGAPH
jgi:hypothetical protein